MRITPCRNGHGAGLTLRFALTDPYGIALLSNCVPFNYNRIVIFRPDLSCNYLSGGYNRCGLTVLQYLDIKLYLKALAMSGNIKLHKKSPGCVSQNPSKFLFVFLFFQHLADAICSVKML